MRRRAGPPALLLALAAAAVFYAEASVTVTVEVRVAASADDAEQNNSTGAVSLTSTDLELITDAAAQTVGIRFARVEVPKGARITSAHVQFKVDETGSTATTLTLRGQAADNAPSFGTATNNVSGRPTTAASITWTPPAWNTVGEAGPAQRTPDLAPIIQEIVNRAGWTRGNALALVITGTGKRVARAYDGEAAGAPLLRIEYENPTTSNVAEFRQGALPHTGYAGARDTHLSATEPSTTFGAAASLTVDGDPDKGALLAWDLAGTLAAGSTVRGASLTLNITNATNDTYEICEVLRPWDEARASWTDTGTGQSWAAPGASGAADCGTDVLGTIGPTATGQRTFALNARGIAVVQRWIDQPATNHGLLVRKYTGAVDSFVFDAKEAANAALRPKLTVEYVPGAGGPPQAGDDAYRTEQGITLVVPAPGVLGNDTGGATGAVKASDPANGTVSLAADGGFSYTPRPGFTGLDSFTYRATGATGQSEVATARVLVMRVPHVIHVSVDGLRPDVITNLGPTQLPHFHRLQREGAFTHNARADVDYTITLPNHTGMLTGRRVTGVEGHGWTGNGEPGGQTLHGVKGSYVASVFDVAHDHGLRTILFAGKTKFVLFDNSYDATNGAPDAVSPDHGRDKIDLYHHDEDIARLVDEFVTSMAARPAHYAFLHIREPDTTGHASGFNPALGSAYSNVVKTVDGLLGRLFALVDGNDTLRGRTAIVLTSDHGGSGTNHTQADVAAHYTVPFFVWGPGVAAGRDLYDLNPLGRRDPGTGRPLYGDAVQPIRNADTANLAAGLLGLPPVPGSHVNRTAPLEVSGANNEPPLAQADQYETDEDTPLSVAAIAGVLANDRDPEGDAITAVLVQGATHGTVVLASDGGFTYTPRENFEGTDSFGYQAHDGLAASPTTTVTIRVRAVNDPPVARPGSPAVTHVGEPYQLDGSASSDPDAGTQLAFSWRHLPAAGQAVVTLTGAATARPVFVPPALGDYTFELTVSDGALSSSARVTIAARDLRAPTGTVDRVVLGGPVDGTGTAATVTVDGAPAAVSGGRWSREVPVSPGANSFTVVIRDEGGNQTTFEARVEVR